MTYPASPQHIGPYRILDLLGEGGMGTVYLAEQREPVRRRVALKVIKLGMDSKAVLARFEAERRALSLMQHSCIAMVLDAGVTTLGQPFFVMEYVRGIPITDYCDNNKLGLKARIGLLQQVCSGVQHAHMKGVMHRDLKPGNVLVTIQDGKPMPKIIDFGLAKATDHHLVEATLFTEQGVLLGTPEYMSPEQAGLGGLDVDTRTDIYSLGVLLYELLVGELPFSRPALRAAGLLEMQRVIREQDPPKPSTRITTLGERAQDNASRRGLSVADLQRRLRGDLDWIVLRALEKDRTRRYETVQELAADLERHLTFQPVLASPPSVGYRVQKFVRRYRAQCAAAALVFVAIVAGILGTTWQARVAGERATRIAAMLETERQVNEANRIYADLTRLAEARAIESTLYPAHPDKVKAMRDWLTAFGEPLAARLPELDAALRELRTRAIRSPPEQPGTELGSSALAEELQRRQHEERIEFDPARRSWLRARIAAIETEIQVAGYSFGDSPSFYLHGRLTQLVNDLNGFTELLRAVRGRLAEATTLKQRTIDAHAAAWQQAIAAIRLSDGIVASQLYGNLVLTPQLGLIPLGMDRESKLWEFVHLASGTAGSEIPTRDEQTGRLVPSGDMGLVFVLLPAGTLPVEDGPQVEARHGERLEPFFLSKYEMTRGQWVQLANPVVWIHTDQRLPVAEASWFDCEEVLRHQGLVLPTALRWEYGCRAGTTTPWWTGSQSESLAGLENLRDGNGVLPVGSRAPNAFGLFDMGGNLREWCLDVVDYRSDRVAGGRSASVHDVARCVRGGSFAESEWFAMSSQQDGLSPALQSDTLGLRPARRVDP